MDEDRMPKRHYGDTTDRKRSRGTQGPLERVTTLAVRGSCSLVRQSSHGCSRPPIRIPRMDLASADTSSIHLYCGHLTLLVE
ncbi:unnamed protein product [Nezara viridula]|uniref:Uncharacterized protein n=1 Tax=Nezara viridula TaxID=85310 RepID=A0A9P0HB11_NEZVI|nr:unnamed protein product [Nezara viridula]